MSFTGSLVMEAIDTLGLSEEVRYLGEPERSEVLRQVMTAFLTKPYGLFWEAHLKHPFSQWHTEHGYTHLPELAPDPLARCWLVTGLTDPDDDMGIFLCSPRSAAALIGECSGFSYAMVDPNLKWMVIENHHDILIGVGEALERLNRLRDRTG